MQDDHGNTTAVVVPIEEWKKFTEKYSDLEDLPEWQKKIIDERLAFVKSHPDKLEPLEDFMKELDLNETY